MDERERESMLFSFSSFFARGGSYENVDPRVLLRYVDSRVPDNICMPHKCKVSCFRTQSPAIQLSEQAKSPAKQEILY